MQTVTDRNTSLPVIAIVIITTIVGSMMLNAQAEYGKVGVLANRCKRQPKACDELNKIALESKKPGERWLATQVLEDQNVLATMALEDTDEQNRSSAAARIKDQKLLAKVAKASSDTSLRQAVAKKLTDRAAMMDVAVNTTDTAIQSALLSTLIQNLNTDELAALLRAIPDFIAFKDRFGNTALVYASFYGHTDVMKTLVANKADVNAANIDGATPLHVSAQKERVDIVDLLLANKADPNAKDKDGWTPMHMAAASGSVEVARALLAAGADISCRNRWGGQPLHSAAFRGRTEMISWLLAKGLDANARGESGKTPLSYVADSGCLECAKLLLSAGADVNAVAENGRSPLDDAAEVGSSEIVSLLLSHRAEVNHRDSIGTEPLAFAARSGNGETVRRLLAAGADVAAADSKGQTALLFAGLKGSVDVARILIAAGAKVDAKTSYGVTTLHVAAENGKTDLIRLLIADGASLEAKMNNGFTPVMLARKSNQSEAVEVLLDAAATPVEVDADNLQIIRSLGPDVVFFTSKAHPIANTADINAPDSQFAVAEFSPRMMRLRKLFGSATMGSSAKADASGSAFAGTGVQFGMPGVVYPLGKTYETGPDGILTGIGEGAVENLFVQHPELRLYAAVRAHSNIEKMENEWGGLRVRFVEKKQSPIETAGPQAPSAEPENKLESGTTKTGSIQYSRVVIRDGALVLKDVHDSFAGDGWISGIVASSNAKILVVRVPSPTFSADSSGVKTRDFTVTVDEKTTLCIAQKPVARASLGTGGLTTGQRVSVAFRKGTQTADEIVDQSYEVVGKLATPTSVSPTRPSMPKCD